MEGGIAIYLRDRAQFVTRLSKQCPDQETREKLNCLAAEFMEKASQLEQLFSVGPNSTRD